MKEFRSVGIVSAISGVSSTHFPEQWQKDENELLKRID